MLAEPSATPPWLAPADKFVSRLTRVRRRRLCVARSWAAAPTTFSDPVGMPLLMVVRSTAPVKLGSRQSSSASPAVVRTLQVQQDRRAGPAPDPPTSPPWSPSASPDLVTMKTADRVQHDVTTFQCAHQRMTAGGSVPPATLRQALFRAVNIACTHTDAGLTEPCCRGMVASYAPVLNAQRTRTAHRYNIFSRDFRAAGVYTWDAFLDMWDRAFDSFPEGRSEKFISSSWPCVQRTLISLALLDEFASVLDPPPSSSPPPLVMTHSV